MTDIRLQMSTLGYAAVLVGVATVAGRWLMPVGQLGLVLPIEGPLLAVIWFRYRWPVFVSAAVVCCGVHLLWPPAELGRLQSVTLGPLVCLVAIAVGRRLPPLLRRRAFESLAELVALMLGILPLMLVYGVAVWPLTGSINGWNLLGPLLQALLLIEAGLVVGLSYYCFIGLPAAFWRFRIPYLGVPVLFGALLLGTGYRDAHMSTIQKWDAGLRAQAFQARLVLHNWLEREASLIDSLRTMIGTDLARMPELMLALGSRESVSSLTGATVFWLPLLGGPKPRWDSAYAQVSSDGRLLRFDPQARWVRDLLNSTRRDEVFFRAQVSGEASAAPSSLVVAVWIGGPEAASAGVIGIRHDFEALRQHLYRGPNWRSVDLDLGPGGAAPRRRADRGELVEPLRLGDLQLNLRVRSLEPLRGIGAFADSLRLLFLGMAGLLVLQFLLLQETGRQLGRRRLDKDTRRWNQRLERSRLSLQETHRMASLGAMVAGITHEVNTPLSTARLAVEDVEAGLGQLADLPEAERKEQLGELADTAAQAVRNLRRAAELMNDFKRISADRSRNARQTIDLCTYLTQIVELMHPRVKNRRQSLELNCAQGMPLVTVPGALSQALIILIENALQHGYPQNQPGTIRIEVEVLAAWVRVVVADDGVGVPPDTRTQIFRQFFTGAEDAGGTGLGLYLAANLVRTQLRGRLMLEESQRGARFRIELPRDAD